MTDTGGGGVEGRFLHLCTYVSPPARFRRADVRTQVQKRIHALTEQRELSWAVMGVGGALEVQFCLRLCSFWGTAREEAAMEMAKSDKFDVFFLSWEVDTKSSESSVARATS